MTHPRHPLWLGNPATLTSTAQTPHLPFLESQPHAPSQTPKEGTPAATGRQACWTTIGSRAERQKGVETFKFHNYFNNISQLGYYTKLTPTCELSGPTPATHLHHSSPSPPTHTLRTPV